MKKIFGLIISCLAISGLLNAQTLNVQVGQVTYQFPAEQAGVMNYAEGTTVNIMNKVFTLADVTTMYVDDSQVKDNVVSVVYNESSANVTVAGNVAQYLTVSVSDAHVDIAQSEDLAEEITYTLSGSSSDGEFYMSGSYKATIELNGLTLTNKTPVKSGAAVHIQNGKRIKVKVMDGTTNTLVDCADGSQKGAFYVKGHPEFSKSGVLNVVGNLKHAIKSGEYIELKDATINVTSAAGDGINCGQYFLMESGVLDIRGVEDDGIQCDIDDTEVGSTGETVDHEDEDSGNIYIMGGSLWIDMSNSSGDSIKPDGKKIISADATVDITNTTTAVENISQTEQALKVYNLLGVLVGVYDSPQMLNALPKGTYVIKNSSITKKISVL